MDTNFSPFKKVFGDLNSTRLSVKLSAEEENLLEKGLEYSIPPLSDHDIVKNLVADVAPCHHYIPNKV